MTGTPQFADFAQIHEGDEVVLTRRIIREDVTRFAELTGDNNPLHLDDAFGARTQFGGAVAHGMLSASLISTVIGTMLPGPGALWMSQTLDFLKPVRAGDTVSVHTRVVSKHQGQRLLELHTTILNQLGVAVIEGKSKVMLLEEKEAAIRDARRPTVALVTGSSRGIGAATARALALQGLKVAVNYANSIHEAQSVVREIEDAGGLAACFCADVGDTEQIQNLVNNVASTFGPVDVLVNNAWPRHVLRPFAETEWSEFERQWNMGVRAAFLCSHSVLPSMIERGIGRIINIGSIAADATPPINQSAYVVAKSALAALTRSMAAELGPKGITVNLVAPGMTDTTFIGDMPQKARMLAQAQTPLRRLARPEDIADVIAFLAGPGGSYVTGETVRVCGGSMML
ncbi:MAG: SDR family oxidoreductase [Capsulimonadaceae bacterium]